MGKVRFVIAALHAMADAGSALEGAELKGAAEILEDEMLEQERDLQTALALGLIGEN